MTMLNNILEFFGLVTLHEHTKRNSDVYAIFDAQVVDLAARLTEREVELAETRHRLALSQRESAAHARTAAHYRENRAPAVVADVVEIFDLGRLAAYTVRLKVGGNGVVNIRSLVANAKNLATLRALADEINERTKYPETRSLLRPATVAPTDGIMGRATGGKPEGFA